MIIAGDIGGTKVNLAYFETEDEGLQVLYEKKYKSADYAGLVPIINDFLKECPGRVDAATFGIAGPVYDGKCKTPNLPWVIEETKLEKELEIGHVSMINDLEANAYGIRTLCSDDVYFLSKTKEPKLANSAIIAAGTGLGEAGLFWNGKEHIPFATESGHADYAPRNDEEFDFMMFMQHKHGRISYDRVLSGSGMEEMYAFFVERQGGATSPEVEERANAGEDLAKVITDMALENGDPMCCRALEFFVKIYGAEAGNLALHQLARGGLYIGGGIAPKILEELKKPAFMEAFLDKGRMKELLETIPVAVILNDKTALQGAAVHASQRRVK
jgi:glucokinase